MSCAGDGALGGAQPRGGGGRKGLDPVGGALNELHRVLNFRLRIVECELFRNFFAMFSPFSFARVHGTLKPATSVGSKSGFAEFRYVLLWQA